MPHITSPLTRFDTSYGHSVTQFSPNLCGTTFLVFWKLIPNAVVANPTRIPRVVPRGGWVFTPSMSFSYTEKGPAGKAQPQLQRSYYLPAGTLVSVQTHTMHHNPAVFTDPYAFRPERWIKLQPEQLDKMNRDFMPFSLGSRACIARNLAMMELNLACAAILESGVLDGATSVGDKIEILEWFNSKVRGERIEIEYKSI